jgi:hypothetical protein
MAIQNPQGEMQYWDNGFPFQGVKLGTNDAGEMQFWDNGFPYQFIFPASSPPPATVNSNFFMFFN